MYNVKIYKDYGWEHDYSEILYKTHIKFIGKIQLKKAIKSFDRRLTLLGYKTTEKHKNYADTIVNKVYYKITLEKENI